MNKLGEGALQAEHWMHQALAQAQLAAACGEVPVGAVVVKGGQVVGSGFNHGYASGLRRQLMTLTKKPIASQTGWRSI